MPGNSQGNALEVPLHLKESGGDGWFQVESETTVPAVDILCRYGVFQRGETAMLLDYAAKYINLESTLDNAAIPAMASGKLKLDLMPSIVEGQLQVQVLYGGQPRADVELILQTADDAQELQLNEDGIALLPQSDRILLRAKLAEQSNGEFDKVAYNEHRYYCTAVIDGAKAKRNAVSADAALQKEDTPELDLFPIGLTSFGAAECNGKWYVVGGKHGEAHVYSKDYQSGDIYRLDPTVDTKSEWEVVGKTTGVQGLATVAYGGKLYVIGGMEARNESEQDDDLYSLDRFSCWDPENGEWQSLPPLPAPRSSMDSCVVGDRLFVVGGWTLEGAADPVWCETGLSISLRNTDEGWNEFSVPFRTRAVAVREIDNQLFVLGGIESKGGPTDAVHVYDLKQQQWHQAAPLPTEGRMKGFGCAALVLNQQLLVSCYDGGIYQWQSASRDWSRQLQLDQGRFFHQMLPLGDQSFALLGGAHMDEGRIRNIEVFGQKSK